MGWSPTRDRLNVFNFSPSYTKPSTSKLFVKTGNNKRVADLLNGAIGELLYKVHRTLMIEAYKKDYLLGYDFI